LEQALDRQDEHELVVLEGDIVDTLGIGNRLPPGLLLHVLLEAGVEVADHRPQADDRLAVQVDDEAEDPVRRGMVRREVDLQDVAALADLRIDLEDRRDRVRGVGAGVDLRRAQHGAVDGGGAPRRIGRRWYETEKRFGFGSGTRARPHEPGWLMSLPVAWPQ